MRVLLPLTLACFFVAGNGARAQSNTAPTTPPPANPQIDREKKMISFLTPEQQGKYAMARAKALGDNPKLKTDGEALMAQADAVLSSGKPAERQEFLEKMNSHRQMLRAAMLKEDGTLGPIFSEIDKHISELKAKHLGQVQGSSSPSTAPIPAPGTP